MAIRDPRISHGLLTHVRLVTVLLLLLLLLLWTDYVYSVRCVDKYKQSLKQAAGGWSDGQSDKSDKMRPAEREIVAGGRADGGGSISQMMPGPHGAEPAGRATRSVCLSVS